MGHHLDANGDFQSDKHPELKPNRVLVNLENPLSARGMLRLAQDYHDTDEEFAEDVLEVLGRLHPHLWESEPAEDERES